jgi:hypothetical protein
MSISLESLVLRGVSVLSDGQPVGLRLGSYEVTKQAKAIPFSMRHPSPGCLTAVSVTGQRRFSAAMPQGNQSANRAGRPGSRAGVLVSRSPAIFAGRTNVYRWSPAAGGQPSTAAARLAWQPAKQTASVADEISRRPTLLDAFALGQRERLQEPRAGHTPARGTLTAASTRGFGLR